MFRSYWLPVIALGLIVCASASQSQPPQNRSHKAVEHQGEPGDGYSAPNPLLPPIVVAPIKTEPYSFQPAAHEQAQQHDDGVKWTDIAIVFLTLVLAGCGIAGAIIAYRQWDALREQVTKLGEAIAAETQSGKDRAAENAAALSAANAANEIARESGRAQTRAYLVITDAGMYTVATHGFPCYVFIMAQNKGRSPARWFEVESNVSLVSHTATVRDVPLDFTGTKRRWSAEMFEDTEIPLVPKSVGKSFRNLVAEGMGTQTIVLQGTLRWETVFGEVFESAFFFWKPIEKSPSEPDGKDHFKWVPLLMDRPTVDLPTFVQVRGPDAPEGQQPSA